MDVVFRNLAGGRGEIGSWRKLQSDDMLMLFAMVTDTILMACINLVATTSSNLINPNDTTPLTPQNIRERVRGSKFVLVVEEMQILTTWTVKLCLLILYHRLTMSLRQNLAVKIVAGYVIGGFILMEVLYLGVWCRPFHEYWAVPTDSTTHHLITNAVLNISSDIMIILIPMPVFLKAGISTKKKIILCSVFTIGFFTIISAILNKYYSFHDPFGSAWVFWYIRESSTALITANLSQTWTLARRVLNLTSFSENSSISRYGPSTGFRSRTLPSHVQISAVRGEDSMLDRSNSQERINQDYPVPLKIYQRREVVIEYPKEDGESSFGH
ncbi:decarboxylase [Grosmannia clavigera kw1407]|uniref:Decarboxylase n=1 Tax=Grosmannia clavigera (strain kw1407 / UAMH 11150) TaxID=655863 RepID=F0X756_GROCL|nr:decarboxylase [Grosmannia clavigera kw1407]EFX06368.1 decarboxylase [Grosmannia clavigera kw1407]